MPRARPTAPSDPAPPACLRWALRYLPHYFTDPPATFHHELLRDLVRSPRRLIARVAPRGHAKSTCAALAYPLWCLCTRRRRNIVIITHESGLARQFLADIRQELEGNERLVARYGELYRTPPAADSPVDPAKGERSRRAPPARRRWSADRLTTSTGISVHAKGSGASLRGTRVGPHRPDLIICDDLEADEQVASPERRKLENWLRRVVIPALAPDGQLLVLGSLLHHDSLLANLRDSQRFPHWDYRVYRALEAPPAGPAGEFTLTPLWPARWPVARLELERERIGTVAFEQEYQANPIDDALRVFHAEWLEPYNPDTLAGRDLVPLLAIDPATGVSGGDYFALWAGALEPASGVLYTRRIDLRRIGIVEQVAQILAAFEEFRPIRIGIEAVAYQVALQQVLEEEGRRRGLFLPVVGLKTLANKRARIEGIAPLLQRGLLRLPAGLSPEAREQFLHFPKARHDDAPDVCAMALELARGLRSVGGPVGGTPARNPFARDGGW